MHESEATGTTSQPDRASGEPENASRQTVQASAGAPVGVRAAVATTPGSARPLRWVRPGGFDLAVGDRVAVREAATEAAPDETPEELGDRAEDGRVEWLGTVVIPTVQLLEWPSPDVVAAWPVVVRRATADEWPASTVTDGSRLLESLELPRTQLQRPGHEM